MIESAASSSAVPVLDRVQPDLVDIPSPPAENPQPSTEITNFLRYQLTRPVTWRSLLVVIVLIAIVAGAGLWWKFGHSPAKPPLAHVAVTTSRSGTVVTLAQGTVDLAQLHRDLVRSGHGSLISTIPGGAIELHADVVVGKQATFDINGSALLLQSDSERQIRLSAQGGTLNFTDDTISSWAQGAVDTSAIGIRANLVAAGRGTAMNFTNCQVYGLGSIQDPGVSWRSGASGTVQDSQFLHNWRGAYAYKSGKLSIQDSSFNDSLEDGTLLLDPGAGSSVRNSTFANNAQSGLEVDGRVDDLKLDNESAYGNSLAGLLVQVKKGEVEAANGHFYDNKQEGISSSEGQLTLDGTKAWANQMGLYVHGGDDIVTNSDLSANTQDGMYITGTSKLTASADRFDHNSISGLWASHGQIVVTDGLFEDNLAGMRISGFSGSLRASGNTITESTKDGISLDVGTGIQIKGNLIDDNGASGISTNRAFNLKALVKDNTLTNNGTATRVRTSD
jgi:parallel beta-helix repeat protein